MCSEEIKSLAMAALLAGQGISAVAREYKLPKGTVALWKQKLEQGEQPTPKPSHVPLTEEMGHRLASMDELVTLALGDMIQSISGIVKIVNNEDYIKSQSATEVAVLLGTISDKAFRVLEAFENAREVGGGGEVDGDPGAPVEAVAGQPPG